MPGAEQQLTLVPCKLGGSAEAALCNARALIAGVEGAAHLSDSDRPSLLLAHLLHEERFSATDVLFKGSSKPGANHWVLMRGIIFAGSRPTHPPS